MSIYLCRWPNGDVSFVVGKNRLAIDEVLDEVGNPDGAEMTRIKHPVAVHLRLKSDISGHETITECLEFEGIDERSYWEICDAYPVLSEAFRNEAATEEKISAALQREKERVDPGPPELPSDPIEAAIQLQMNMPKRLAKHYKEVVKTSARKDS
jgi:hypothetical protein